MRANKQTHKRPNNRERPTQPIQHTDGADDAAQQAHFRVEQILDMNLHEVVPFVELCAVRVRYTGARVGHEQFRDAHNHLMPDVSVIYV